MIGHSFSFCKALCCPQARAPLPAAVPPIVALPAACASAFSNCPERLCASTCPPWCGSCPRLPSKQDITNPRQLDELSPRELSFWVGSLFAGSPYQQQVRRLGWSPGWIMRATTVLRRLRRPAWLGRWLAGCRKAGAVG